MLFNKITISAIVLMGSVIMLFESDLLKSITTSDQTIPYAVLEEYDPIVVLELFTSQGCSSCPPADALLDKVKNEFESSVFALSYHVDYWNYIGWKDPFSKSKYAEKQRTYNTKFKNRTNYTPQIVVNGKVHFVGSSPTKLYGAINSYGTEKVTNKVVLTNVRTDKNNVLFQYSVSGSHKNKSLRAVLVLDQRTTQVRRGENRDRVLKNSNIVVAEKNIAIDSSMGCSYMTIPEIVDPDEKIGLVLLLENKDYDIAGAAKSIVPR